MPHIVNELRFPDDVEPEDVWFYRMEFDGDVTHDLTVDGATSLLYQAEPERVDVEMVASGVSDGVYYAAAKTTIVVEHGTFAAIGGADAASQQVRDPEHVWSVASSRSFKRAVKRAFGIINDDGHQTDREQTGDIPIEDPPESGGSVNVDEETGGVDVEPPPEYDPAPSTDPVETEDGRDW